MLAEITIFSSKGQPNLKITLKMRFSGVGFKFEIKIP